MAPKKIIIACDGTWTNSDDGFRRTSSWFSSNVEGYLAVPSNVTRFCRALTTTHTNGSPQLCYYQAGLGSASNWYSYYVGGYLGEGLSENIREAYVFLCDNYEEGDEIYLIGFSRGAFTARSIGGLIDAVGLLTRKGLEDFYCIFRDWEHMGDANYYKPTSKEWVKSLHMPEPRIDYGRNKEKYVNLLVKQGLTRPDVPVEATGVWDTVGTLGIPTFVVPPFSWFQNKNAPKAYAFVDTALPKNLKHAYQALALDERRTPFSPTLWEHPSPDVKTNLKELKQCWFAGTHSNVGGSYPDTGIADITLAWMIQQLSNTLTFNPAYLPDQEAANRAWVAANSPNIPRPWSCGRVYPSNSAVQDFLVGASNRTPGTYKRLDPITGRPTATPLRATQEYIHPSVRIRRALGGLGTNDVGTYNDPWPLKDWTLIEPQGAFSAATELPAYKAADLWGKEWADHYIWVTQAADGKVTWIAEEKLQAVEAEIVGTDAQVLAEIAKG